MASNPSRYTGSRNLMSQPQAWEKWTRLALPIFVLGLLVTGGFVCEKSAADGGRTPVVLVVFDEFPTMTLLDRKNQISKSRFPNFHRLSKGATWYRNNTSPSHVTAQAVPSILTGRGPVNTRPDYREYPDSIYRFMSKAGYSVRNLEIYTQLCPPDICKRRKGQPIINPKRGESPHNFGSRVFASVRNRERERLKWIAGLRKLRNAEFAFGHFKLPHGPFKYLPNGKGYRDSERFEVVRGRDRIIRRGNPGVLEAYEKRLLLQVGYVDTLLGKIIRNIKKSGKWKETTFVVTSDHGVSIRPGYPRRKPVSGNKYFIGLTPLFIKYRGQKAGRESEAMTGNQDIVPTIASTLDRDNNLYQTDGIPIKVIPSGRVTQINGGLGRSLTFKKVEISRWMKKDARARSRRMGNRGLHALGPLAKSIGLKAPVKRSVGRNLVSIPGFANLGSKVKQAKLPPLIQGYVKGRVIPKGSSLQLAFGKRVVATSSVFEGNGRKAFAFPIHHRYLRGRGLVRVRVFWRKSSGARIRVF